MLKAILFDVDGVLVDSREANIAFFQALLSRAGYHDISREDILSCFHLPLWGSLEKLTGSNSQSEIQRIFDMAKDASLRDKALLNFPDKLEDVLEELHKHYRLAVVTSRIRQGMDTVFSAKEIEHLFDVVVTFEDYNNPKPHPEPLLVALKKLSIQAKEAIYIGDSPSDMDAAKAAGMKGIFISRNDHHHAIARIDEFNELLEVLKTIP